MRYANRAIELYQLVGGDERGEELESAFLAVLAEARSNLPEMGDGAEVYRKLVVRSRVSHERLAAQEAILSLFVHRPRELRVGDYYVRRIGERHAGDARFALTTGRLSSRWIPTGEAKELLYPVLHVGAPDVCCAVKPLGSPAAIREAGRPGWRRCGRARFQPL